MHIGDLQISIDELLFERFHLPAQLLDLLILYLGELLLLQFDLLILVLKIIKEFSHLGQLVLML